MSTHNIYFHGEIKKKYSPDTLSSGAMLLVLIIIICNRACITRHLNSFSAFTWNFSFVKNNILVDLFI